MKCSTVCLCQRRRKVFIAVESRTHANNESNRRWKLVFIYIFGEFLCTCLSARQRRSTPFGYVYRQNIS